MFMAHLSVSMKSATTPLVGALSYIKKYESSVTCEKVDLPQRMRRNF